MHASRPRKFVSKPEFRDQDPPSPTITPQAPFKIGRPDAKGQVVLRWPIFPKPPQNRQRPTQE
jgi:hypothetical protein